MSGTEERDDWLDAFDLDELEDPALPEVDAAAERIGTALGSGPTRSWLVPTALVAVAAGVLLGVGVGVGVWLVVASAAGRLEEVHAHVHMHVHVHAIEL